MRVALAAAGMLVAVSAPLCAQPAEQGKKPAARAPRAMVSSSHPVVTEAMLEVLRGGGNAVDAMIAGVILQPVIEPQMSTLAGGIGALIYDARSGRFHYLDAELDHTSVDAPIGHSMEDRAGVSETSGRRVGVPGTVAGLSAAAERFGTKKWAEYFPPAIRLAEDGYPMYSFLYAEMAEAALGRLSSHPSGREEFLSEGFVPPVGMPVKRPRLAATLKRLASEGPGFFYEGEWARRFVDAVKGTGGTVSLEDLAGYEARWTEPIRSTYGGHEIWSSPPPATGGALIALTLNILESADLRRWATTRSLRARLPSSARPSPSRRTTPTPGSVILSRSTCHFRRFCLGSTRNGGRASSPRAGPGEGRQGPLTRRCAARIGTRRTRTTSWSSTRWATG